MSFYRIGVDVGGTNTDAVIIDVSKKSDKTRGVIASYKHATTPDVTDGIERAVQAVLKDAGIPGADADSEARRGVISLTIGTTHFINAVLQSDPSKLSPVAVVRLAAPYTTECPSFIDFPENLKRIMNGHTAVVSGGLQIDGRTINDLVDSELVEQSRLIRDKGIKDIVLVGVYSPLDVSGKQEYKARQILLRELGGEENVNIVCSRDVAQVGFLERENASILNTSIMRFAKRTIGGFKRAMRRLDLHCPLYLTQNDGTLLSASQATRLPIRTFSSGATNSMCGASYLAGFDSSDINVKGAIVVDIGGTSTDVGMLLPSGLVRQAAAFINVGGVRTNFSMPDVHSIGLGGGSRVRFDGNAVTVGPDSVGYRLMDEAKVFGGDVLTATCVCAQDIGDKSRVAYLEGGVVKEVTRAVQRSLEGAIDRMKTSAEPCTVLLVGGGSVIAPPALRGVSEIITPPFHSVANAVGAAIARVSGTVDTIEVMEGRSLAKELDRIKNEAIDKVLASGGNPDNTKVAEIDVLPIQYVTNQTTRIIVKAIGELKDDGRDLGHTYEENEVWEDADKQENDTRLTLTEPEPTNDQIDYKSYRPRIEGNEWVLSETDLLFIMEGCGVLGTGGGGSPYPSYLMCRQVLRDGGSIKIIDHSSLKEDAIIIRGGFMGSPSVGSERIRGASQIQMACEELTKYCGITNFDATLCDEIGGGNGMQSLLTSSYYGVPALDADLMGRAYPNLYQLLPAVYEVPNALVPCSLCDGDGNVVLLTKVKNEHLVETIMRTVTTEMGSSAALCPPPLLMKDVKDFGVLRSESQAWWIGRAIAVCRQSGDLNSVAKAILEVQNGVCLFVGKIVDVTREVRAGFTWGQIRIATLLEEERDSASESEASAKYGSGKEQMVIPFQNENICAYVETPDGSRSVAASVPDLIAVLDSQSGSHLGTQDYRYGLRVTVIAMAGSPLWHTEAGLKTGGPAAFGLDHPFVPVGEYKVPNSVIEAFGSAEE